MQNSKQAVSVAGTVENKRPNILRRKTSEKNKSPTNVINNYNSLLLPAELIDGNIVTLNTYDGDINSSYCSLLPEVFETRFDDEPNHIVLNTQQSNNNKKIDKNVPRKRRPSQKIILDTYICDKNRIAKQKADEIKKVDESSAPPYTLLKNVKPFVPLENNTLQDVSILEEIPPGTIKEEDVSSLITPSEVENVVSDLQENFVPADQNIVFDDQSIVVDANLESEDVLLALRENGFSEGELLFLFENDGESRQMWLCPLGECNTLFSDRGMLNSHILSHLDLKTFTCNIDKCNKTYIHEDKLKQHQQDCHMETQCNTTESWEEVKRKARNLVTEALVSVGVSEDMMQSVVLADGSRCWPCSQPDCSLVFKTQYLLKNHILAHHDLRPFKCTHPGCGWAFRSLAKLRVHSEIHSGVRKHICSIPGCCKYFSNKSNLTLHLNKVHGDGTLMPCPMRGCEETFSDKLQLKDHFSSLHADNKCDVCGKGFWLTSRLVAHSCSRVQTQAELQCTWPGCGKVFSQPSRLRYHQRSHTGDKPYRCTYPSCFWAFPSASKLRRHARAHAGENGRKYSCSICNKTFTRAEHLREHHLRHFPQRQYMCDVPGCQETFANKSSVYVHKKRDHSGKAEGKLRSNKKSANNKVLVSPEEVQPTPVVEEGDVGAEEMLSLRSARTHVPWKGYGRMLTGGVQEITNKTVIQDDCSMLQHHTGIEEKQGNPLVCGGLELDGGEGEEMVGGSSVGAELCLGEDVSQQGVDLNINSLLMQEELSEGMLYTTEDDSALHVLLLNEEPPP